MAPASSARPDWPPSSVICTGPDEANLRLIRVLETDDEHVELDSSANIALDDLSFNKTNGTGVLIRDSSGVTLDKSKLKDDGDERPDGDGIYAVDSYDIKVGRRRHARRAGLYRRHIDVELASPRMIPARAAKPSR